MELHEDAIIEESDRLEIGTALGWTDLASSPTSPAPDTSSASTAGAEAMDVETAAPTSAPDTRIPYQPINEPETMDTDTGVGLKPEESSSHPISYFNLFSDMEMDWLELLSNKHKEDFGVLWNYTFEESLDNPTWHCETTGEFRDPEAKAIHHHTYAVDGNLWKGSGPTKQHARDQAAYKALTSESSHPHRNATMRLFRTLRAEESFMLSLQWDERRVELGPWECSLLGP